jgi:BirA family biotin operon repressor/biotin-[acetyl-CoA-carboxylase] ligase
MGAGERDAILKALYDYQPRYVSGGELARRLGTSRTLVWKEIQTLRREGYSIHAAPRRGYCLAASPDLLTPFEVKRGLKTKTFGGEVRAYPVVKTTNDLAKEWAEEGAPEGSLVVAEVQEGGKGRLGRRWHSPRGGVWLSLILRPPMTPEEAPRLGLLAGVGVVRTLSRLYGLEAGLKWPNDILLGGKKVGGILLEMSAEMGRLHYVVLGIGVNVDFDFREFPPELRAKATTLRGELGRNVSRLEVLRVLLEELEALYGDLSKGNPRGLLEEARRLSLTLGTRVRVETPGETYEGRAVDLDPEGALLLSLGEGRVKRILSGDCLHLEGGGGV